MESSATFDQVPADRDRGPTLLIVDDQAKDRERVVKLCEKTAHSETSCILQAGSIEEALAHLSSQPVHVVLLDKDLGPSSGIEWIAEMIRLQPHVQIIMVTGSNQIRDAVRAVRLGALSYVTKDTDPEYLIVQINTAVRMAKNALFRIRAERAQVPARVSLGGQSREFQTVLAHAKILAESIRPVLIRGETGTGKTEIARLIHEERLHYLKQPSRPFVELNIAGLSSELVEGELFGRDQGAYTGADSKRQGYIEMANGGTLFLDEIGDAPEKVQIDLLKVLETGKFFRLGGEREMSSSFKLICATHRNLEELVRQGRFREDLYHRISTFSIEMPRLEDRRQDIPDIIRALLARCCSYSNVLVDYDELPKDFIEHLTQHVPKGNVRGLQNQLERLLVYSPKDSRGKPVFSNWRKISGLYDKARGTFSGRSSLSVGELVELPIHLDDTSSSGFPGLAGLMSGIEDRLIRAAKSKFTKNREIARWLRVSDSVVSNRLRLMESRDQASVTPSGLTSGERHQAGRGAR